MKWTLTIAIVLALNLLILAVDKPVKQQELLQGLWSVESITNNGQAVPDEAAQRLILVVKGNERIVRDGDEVKSKSTFTVDDSKTPKQMDVTVSDGPLAGKTYRGIYEIKGDTFTLCLALEGDKRPTTLTSEEGSNQLLQVFKKSNASEEKVKEPELRVELLARRKADQADRMKVLAVLKKSGGKPEGEALEQFQALVAELADRDAKNAEWLKGVVKKQGWPGFALVGQDGAEAAFVLAQHSGPDLKFQKHCLELLQAAVNAKQARAIHLAYLTDRVRVASGQKQVYGTEVQEQDGDLVTAAIEDAANVDARRKEVGLPTLAEGLKQARRERGYPEKK